MHKNLSFFLEPCVTLESVLPLLWGTGSFYNGSRNTDAGIPSPGCCKKKEEFYNGNH